MSFCLRPHILSRTSTFFFSVSHSASFAPFTHLSASRLSPSRLLLPVKHKTVYFSVCTYSHERGHERERRKDRISKAGSHFLPSQSKVILLNAVFFPPRNTSSRLHLLDVETLCIESLMHTLVSPDFKTDLRKMS